MAWLTKNYKLTGSAPLLMNNGEVADPLNKFAKLKNKITSKKKKVDADYEELAHLDFIGALYMSKDGPVIPAHVIEGMMLVAAKKFRMGPTCKAALYCDKHALLEYRGPKTAEGLWNNKEFHHVAMVVINGRRISKTRPVFNNWAIEIEVHIENSLLDSPQVLEWLIAGGTQCGLGDWRPKYGRFTVEEVATVES